MRLDPNKKASIEFALSSYADGSTTTIFKYTWIYRDMHGPSLPLVVFSVCMYYLLTYM